MTPKRILLSFAATSCAVFLCGCGPTLGWWAANLFGGQSVQAKHELDKDKRLLVVVTDEAGGVQHELIKQRLAERLTVLLDEHDAAGPVVDPKQYRYLRARDLDFHDLSLDEIARRLGADQVLHVKLTRIIEANNPEGNKPEIGASVVVREAESGREIWPTDMIDGYTVGPVSLDQRTASNIQHVQRRRDKLIDQLAQTIARLFYKHKAEGV
jgi:hypothetical protein